MQKLIERFSDMAEPMRARKAKLVASLELQQFMLSVQDQVKSLVMLEGLGLSKLQMSWTRSAQQVASSNQFGENMTEVQVLEVRHRVCWRRHALTA